MSQDQAIVSAVLTQMKLEREPDTSGKMGSPGRFTVTTDTVEYVKSLEGKTFVLHSDGKLTPE